VFPALQSLLPDCSMVLNIGLNIRLKHGLNAFYGNIDINAKYFFAAVLF